MKPLLSILSLIALVGSSVAAPPPSTPRTLTNINVISTRVLQRSISRKFYKSLLISPITGWIVVRGNLSGAHLSGTRVVHSELNGAYDALALKLASEVVIAGYYSIDRRIAPPVTLNLLIYQIADGTMALSFPTFDEAGGNQWIIGVARGSRCSKATASGLRSKDRKASRAKAGRFAPRAWPMI
jgi:hypothetical protein